MSDLKSPAAIYFKGFLFLLTGLVAAGLLVAESPTLKAALLLAVSIWCFCRFYYFAFYVIEHYVDAGYKFSGLTSFFGYLLDRRRSAGGATPAPADRPRAGDSPAGTDPRA
jgi:hypothetical protein